MFSLLRRLVLVAPLVLAVGGPFVALSDTTRPWRDQVRNWFASESAESAVDQLVDPATGLPLAAGQAVTGRLGDMPSIDLRRILRFDITPQWVTANWPHVATTHTDPRFQGLRVALVTGTQPYDVAGSLTYYFDAKQVVQRITMQGLTGDYRPLVNLATQSYRLQRSPQAGVELYLAKWNGQPTSALWIQQAPVVDSNDVHHRFAVAMELNRPGNYVQLSDWFQQALKR